MLEIEVFETNLDEDVIIVRCQKCHKRYMHINTTVECPGCKTPALNVRRVLYDEDDRLDWHTGAKDFIEGA